MNKRMIKSKLRCLRRILLLCLCAVMLTGSALAEDVADISGEGFDCMYYKCTLPDGRVILTGCKGTAGNYIDSRARILCLNPDMTVSWDYIDPSEGCCSFTWTALLKDGTLGVVFENSPYQTPLEKKLVFFTLDGKPTGKEVVLTEPGGMVNNASASCVWQFDYPESGGLIEELLDWEGKAILRYEGDDKSPFSGMEEMFEEEDGLVFAGRERGNNGCAKILKMDFQGSMLWENVLPLTAKEAEDSSILDCIRMADGSYVALVGEFGRVAKDGVSDYANYRLVKFSPGGRILWTNSEAFDRYPEKWYGGLAQYNGRFVVEMADPNLGSSKNLHAEFLWMDEEGNWLGTTELNKTPKDFPRIAKEKKPYTLGVTTLIPTKEGLWALIDYEAEKSTHLKQMDTQDDYLVKVPEL